MGDVYQYPVFLQCGRRLSAQQRRAVERHFSLRRRSSGGDCGPLARAGPAGYSLAFRSQTDQQRVLQRCEHVVELADGPLMLTVHGSLESHNSSSIAASTPSQESTAPAQSPQSTPASIPPPGGEEYELRPDTYLLCYLKECPKVWQDLEAELVSMACSAQLYPEEERVLVRRLAQPGAADEGRNWKADVDKVFDGYLCHFEVDPHKTKALRQSCSSHQATDGVKVYGEMGIAVVVGKHSQVKARLMEVEDLTVKHRRSHSNEKLTSICRLGEAKLRLLWRQIEQGVGQRFPGVEVTRRDVGQVALEGSVKDVLEAVDWISDKENLVSERTVGNLRPHLLAFLRKAYGGPGELRDFLGVDDDMEIELQDTELRLFSLSAYKLDEAEEALQREFREMKVDVPDCPALSSELMSKTYEMNQVQFRAQVLFDSSSTVCLLGHTKEVEELRETITQLILQSTEDFGLAQELSEFLQLHGFDLSEVTEVMSLLSPFVDSLVQALSLKDENTVVASYSLCDGLQVEVCQDDVTKQKADTPVNTANEDLGNCGGVAAAGSKESPESQRESSTLKEWTGDKEVTTVGNLLCEKLLHDSGAIAGETGGRVGFLLEKTVQFTLNMAEMMEIKYLALPCTVSGGSGVSVCSEAIVTAVEEFGSQGGRGLRRIALVDNRAEVVRAMQDACDRLLQGGTGYSPPSDLGLLTDAAAQETASGATVGPPGDGVHVETVQATIESQQVDAVVSPMFGHNPLSTRVGNTLSKIVGSQLTAMFTKESEEGTTPGDAVLVEGFTGLPSNAVIFLNLVPWDDEEDGTAVQVMRLGINAILTACDNRGFGSVALPVLGAGLALGFPNSVVARVLQEQVHAFKQNRASRTPFLVRIVIHPSDTEASEVFRGFMKDEDLATMRIVLLGKSGSGKSTLANCIFGSEELFATSLSPNSVTSQCQAETRLVNGRSITLIDTPGFFDSHRPEEDIKSEMARCITECAPGPHAFLIVLQVDRFTSQEQAVIAKIRQYFSDDALKHAVVVFTHGDQLAEGSQIEDFVGQNEDLSELVRKCGGRCHVFDNKYWKNKREDDYRSNRFQAEVLLKTIDKMVMDNKGGYYTNEKLQAVRAEIKREEERIRHARGNMSRSEIRQRAIINVSNRLLIQLAGTATGAVLGAFFGLALMVGFDITAMNSLSQLSKLKGIPAAGKGVAAAVGLGEVAVIGTGVVAAAGGLFGGCVGYAAAQGARTPQEAAMKAATAVFDKSKAFNRK